MYDMNRMAKKYISASTCGHSSVNSKRNIKVCVTLKVINHIHCRHTYTPGYDKIMISDRPSLFFDGYMKIVRMTLACPDVKQHKQRSCYFRRFDFPIGTDNNGNKLYICMTVVNKFRNTLITAYPIRKYHLEPELHTVRGQYGAR